MGTIGVTIESEQFQDIVTILETIERNTRRKGMDEADMGIGMGMGMMDINAFRGLFFSELDSETGWGRNELKRVFDECVRNIQGGA